MTTADTGTGAHAALPLGPPPGRTLVTGGAGYLGGLLTRFLAGRGVEVTSFDRLADPAPDPRVRYVQGDLRDREAIAGALHEQRADVVFHCAALLPHERPGRGELEATNVGGTANLIAAAAAAGVRKIVHTSTICVYGRSFPEPVGEDVPVCPVEAYGRSKVAAEELLAAAPAPLLADSIRCPTVISAGRLGMLTILFEFVREDRRVYMIGDGSNRYQFVYAPDLLEACWRSARAPGSQVWHVGAERVPPLAEVYGAVIAAAGSRSRLVRLPEAPAQLALAVLDRLRLSPLGPYHARLLGGTFVFDTRRIREQLGWRPTRGNDEMLVEAYHAWCRRPGDRSAALSAHHQRAKMGALRLVKWLS